MSQEKSELELDLADEVRYVIRKRQKELKLTNAELSKLSTIKENTLEYYFSGRMDFSVGKALMLFKALKIKVRLIRAGKVKR